MMHRRRTLVASLAAAMLALALIGVSASRCGWIGFGGSEPDQVVLASAISLQDTGLLDVLIPAFEEAYPDYKVHIEALGAGKALDLGRVGDADVLLINAPADEEAFMARGFGTERRRVMYNDFIIAGPDGDPAGIAGRSDASKALADIATVKAPFISRGDNSGTHKKELALWSKAELSVDAAGPWYHPAELGARDTLRIASEEAAYTLVDRATYLTFQEVLTIPVLVEGDEMLLNQYSVIPSANAKDPDGALAFADWVTGLEAQKIILDFRSDEFDRLLYLPDAER